MSEQCRRVGVTLPLAGLELAEHRGAVDQLVAAGIGEVSTAEVNGVDGLTPLVLCAAWQADLQLTCAVVSVFTRGPATLAMTAAGLAETAPGRARFGIGAGSDRIVHGWNGIPFTRPHQRVADTVRFLRAVLTRGRVDPGTPAAEAAERLGSHRFRLDRAPTTPPKLLIAALGPRMQQLAAAEADGVVLNFLSPTDVAHIRAATADVPRAVDTPFEVTARVFVIPGDGDAAELAARRQIAAYLTVPVYTSFHRWLGRGGQLTALLAAWASGDRARAVEAIPDQLVRDLIILGSPADCAAGIRRYLDAGIDLVTIALIPPHGTPMPAGEQIEFLCDLARRL